MESNPLEFFESVRQGYLRLAEEDPGRIVVIDASASIDEVTEEINLVFSQRVGALNA